MPTPLSAIVQAAGEHALDLEIKNGASGVYLSGLHGELDGWQYRVNDCLPMEAADRNGSVPATRSSGFTTLRLPRPVENHT